MSSIPANSSSRTGLTRGVIALGALAALLGFSACDNTKKAQAVSTPPAPVTAASAEVRDVPITITAVGNIQPYSTVEVKSMVTAPVLSVHIKPGDFVKKGQLLFTLDPRTFQADLAKAQGQLARDAAAAANARQQAQRYAALFKEGVVAREQNDLQQSTAAQLEAAIEADKAAVESSKINLQYTKIYAPIAGRAGDVLVYPGNLIKANDVAMVVLNQVEPIYVEFSIPERNLTDIKKYEASGGLKVNAVFPDASEPAAAGRLTFINNAVDPKTGTIALKASFPNQDHRLWPGQFVNVVTTLRTEPNAVVVPLSAVQSGQQGPYLYVVKQDSTVELRQLELGPQIAELQVVRKGVAQGETVVTDGQMRVAPGAKVDVKQAAQANGAAAGGNQQQQATK